MTVTYDGASSTAKVFGVAQDQATKEKVILAAGNVHGVAGVQDMMTVDLSQPEDGTIIAPEGKRVPHKSAYVPRRAVPQAVWAKLLTGHIGEWRQAG